MLIARGSYQNYQNGSVSNQLTVSARRGGCVWVTDTLLMQTLFTVYATHLIKLFYILGANMSIRLMHQG
jgi:hypothetical protein